MDPSNPPHPATPLGAPSSAPQPEVPTQGIHSDVLTPDVALRPALWPWEWHAGQGTIAHAQGCAICDAYLDHLDIEHRVGVQSLTVAEADRIKALAQGEWTRGYRAGQREGRADAQALASFDAAREISRLTATVRTLQNRNDKLSSDLHVVCATSGIQRPVDTGYRSLTDDSDDDNVYQADMAGVQKSKAKPPPARVPAATVEAAVRGHHERRPGTLAPGRRVLQRVLARQATVHRAPPIPPSAVPAPAPAPTPAYQPPPRGPPMSLTPTSAPHLPRPFPLAVNARAHDPARACALAAMTTATRTVTRDPATIAVVARTTPRTRVVTLAAGLIPGTTTAVAARTPVTPLRRGIVVASAPRHTTVTSRAKLLQGPVLSGLLGPSGQDRDQDRDQDR
ncbi:hypothetical protein VTO73DRAFT_14348 [Trametes versicolor]